MIANHEEGTSTAGGKCPVWLGALLVLGCVGLLAGCVAPQPVSHYVRTGPNYASRIGSTDRLGIVSDAAILYDRSGSNDCYSIEDSLVVATNMLADARRHLAKKGYQVVAERGTLVGACLDASKPHTVAGRRHQDPAAQDTPFYCNAELVQDPAYRDAVVQVIRRAQLAVSDRGELPTETLREEPSIQESLNLIARHDQVRFLMVVSGNGKIVSSGKQIGQAIGTTILSTLFTGGLVTATVHNISFLDSFVGLVDLETGEMLWSNSLRLGQNPASPGLYKGAWSHALLYHLPDRAQAKS